MATRILLSNRWIVLFVAVGSLLSWLLAASQEPARQESAAGSTVEGTVVYQADPARPWRLSRYYIQWPKRGELAEAVVALQGKGLTGINPASKAAATDLGAATIDQKDFRFSPETIAIRAGDSVRFTNSDTQVHNVRTADGVAPFNVNTPMGGDYTHRFERGAGIRSPIRIGCSYHGQMRAWIFVFGHSFFAVTGEEGKFKWTGVPPGEYELVMAHPGGSLRATQRIQVAAGETVRVEFKVSPDQLVEEEP